ncbi:MAG TPA: ATP-binding cassette domain-containing protein [Chthoniobacterales bacterium]
MPALLLQANQLKAERCCAGQPVERVDGFSGAFPPGTVCELMGPENGGKHLLWRLLTLLQRPTEGDMIIGDQSMITLAEGEMAAVRNRDYGYLFAIPYLLPGFTVVENVAMPLFKLRQVEPAQARTRTEAVLRATGLLEVASAQLGELSALQHQLVALARAMIHGPVFLAVERFGENLTETETARLSEICQYVAEWSAVSVIATAAPGLTLPWANLKFEIENGRVTENAGIPGRS